VPVIKALKYFLVNSHNKLLWLMNSIKVYSPNNRYVLNINIESVSLYFIVIIYFSKIV